MKNKIGLLLGLSALSITAIAADSIEAKVERMANVRGNGAIEVCGSVSPVTGKAAWVTVTHADSKYSTLSSPEGEWCTLVRRATFDGKVEVSARAFE